MACIRIGRYRSLGFRDGTSRAPPLLGAAQTVRIPSLAETRLIGFFPNSLRGHVRELLRREFPSYSHLAPIASVQCLAVQLQARRRVGATIVRRCPCGGIAICNGWAGQSRFSGLPGKLAICRTRLCPACNCRANRASVRHNTSAPARKGSFGNVW